LKTIREKRKERRRRKKRRSDDIDESERADDATVVDRKKIRNDEDEEDDTWSRADARSMRAQAENRRVIRADDWIVSVEIEHETDVEVQMMCRKIWKKCWREEERNSFIILVWESKLQYHSYACLMFNLQYDVKKISWVNFCHTDVSVQVSVQAILHIKEKTKTLLYTMLYT